MPNFEKLFDEVLAKAKDVADSTGKLTGEMVEVGKLKYKAKQISWETERMYARLGVIVYEAKKTGGDFDAVVDAAVEEIDALNAKLDVLEEKIRDIRRSERYRPSKVHAEQESEVDIDEANQDTTDD